MWHNYWMIPMIIVDWVMLTVVLKNTEENGCLMSTERNTKIIKSASTDAFLGYPKSSYIAIVIL